MPPGLPPFAALVPACALRAALLTLAASASLFGCDAAKMQLRTRAAFDMKCDRSALTLYTMGDRTVGVTGCGRRATYVEVCEIIDPYLNTRGKCTWVIDGEIEDGDDGPKKRAKHGKKSKPSGEEEEEDE